MVKKITAIDQVLTKQNLQDVEVKEVNEGKFGLGYGVRSF